MLHDIHMVLYTIWIHSEIHGCIHLLFACTDIVEALNHQLDVKWQHFGNFLCVDYQIMEAIKHNKDSNPADCMLDLLGKWTSNQAGTNALPQTWQTVVEAVQHCGYGLLAQELAFKHGVTLPH